MSEKSDKTTTTTKTDKWQQLPLANSGKMDKIKRVFKRRGHTLSSEADTKRTQTRSIHVTNTLSRSHTHGSHRNVKNHFDGAPRTHELCVECKEAIESNKMDKWRKKKSKHQNRLWLNNIFNGNICCTKEDLLSSYQADFSFADWLMPIIMIRITKSTTK